ncbi:hypothetical protein M569_04261 [Genlisea aurea]|uniref:Uncharacterized protein n=1 Tax=Genlisea aurea TaxID=192259 RepID=S8EDA8_9LAMI|nr:hypothetical protein M569_04261 [Genlisea aurea]
MAEVAARFHHDRKPHSKRRSACMRRRRSPLKRRQVWVPAIPSWEKQFLLEVGSFEWADFVAAKKQTRVFTDILEWNDSAAREALEAAKERFYRRVNGLDPKSKAMDPDLHIDEIDWNDRYDDDDPVFDRKSVSEYEDVRSYHNITMDEIQATGWDVESVEFSAGKKLTGLIMVTPPAP